MWSVIVMEASASFDLPFLGFSKDLRLTCFNAEAASIFDLQESGLGKSVSEILGEEALPYFQGTIDSIPRVQQLTYHHRPLYFQIYPLKASSETAFVICVLPEALRKAREAAFVAEAANAAKSKFMAMMTHDLRTPLGIIVSMSEIIQSGQVTPARRQEYLSNILESAETLLHLVDDILDYSKSEAGKLRLHEEAFNLVDLVDHLKTSFRYKAHERDVRFAARIDSRLSSQLISDPKRLRQIWYNLIDNAIKYTPEGRLVSFRVELLEYLPDQRVKIRSVISDQGLGIPQEKLANMFEEFGQIHEGEHHHYALRRGGVGLGLAIVKKMAALLGAEISVDSELGKGSKFTCDFTAKLAPVVVQPRSLDPISLGSASLAGLKVLLVEDHPLNRKVILHLLEGFSCVTDIAFSGGEALSKLSEHLYDAVLMDINLEDMTGFEVLHSFRKAHPERATPMIAVTANAHAEDREACLAAGFQGFLVKPVDQPSLRAALQACVSFMTSPSG